MAVAIQPALPRHNTSPVPTSATRPQQSKRRMSGKENLVNFKPPADFKGISYAKPRRERPCDACRRRKSRCVIHEGAVLCVLCEFHKQDCTFVQDPQPRKRKVVTDAEKRGSSPKKRSIEVNSAQNSAAAKVPAKHSISPFHRPNVRIQKNVLGDTLGLHTNRHGRYIGLTSPFDPTLIGLSKFDSRNESTLRVGILRRVTEHETFIMLADEDVQNFADDADALESIERIISPHGPALVDLYFRVVHPSFPIIQKRIFLERYYSGDRSFAPALIAGMYILALNWWSHEPKLSSQRRPDISQLVPIASSSLSAAMQRPKLSTVQAGLLLLQRPEADSWSMTTQLVAVGQELGLHLDCSNWAIPLWERELRKRIAWALYMQDKWSSLIHGRPSHIFGANWAVKPISADEVVVDESSEDASTLCDSEEERAEVEKGKVLFSQMIILTSIMAEILDTFYTQVAIQDFANAGNGSTRLILDRAKPVQIKLKEWYSKLPSSVRMDSVVPGRLSSTGFLHLAYFATEITLHRRIVQSLNEGSDAYLTHICRSAAKTRLISALDFVNRLKPEQLQAFWYFPSKINFTLIGTFGGLLWATAPAKEEADFYRARLREYRWTLSVSSKRADFLEFAVQMLDTSRSMLKNLAEKPSLADRISTVGVPDPTVGMSPGSGPQQQPSPADTDHERQQDQLMQDVPTVSPALTRHTSISAMSAYSESREAVNTPPSSVG